MRVLLLGFCSLALAACSFDFDEVGPRPAGGGASGGGGASQGGDGAGAADGGAPDGGAGAGGDAAGGGGGRECAVGDCVELPGTFSAPFTLQDVPCELQDVIVSGGEYAEGSTLVAEPATCGCACQQPQDLGCPDLQFARYATANCSSQATGGSIAEDACVASNNATFSIFVGAVSFGNPTGTCTSNNVPSTRPPLIFQNPLYGCAAPTGDCAVGTCLSAAQCVYSKDDQACPQGMVERFLVREEDVADDRACSCLCGAVLGQCMFDFDIFGDGGCQGPLTFTNDTGCITDEQGGAIGSVRYSPFTTGGCFTGQETTGAAVVESTVLVCCAE